MVDSIHPIIPVDSGISPITRIAPEAIVHRGAEQRREDLERRRRRQAKRARELDEDFEDGDDSQPHVDVTA
jgi:hypothetical protein